MKNIMAKNIVRVCCGMTCGITGSRKIMSKLEESMGLKAGEQNEENDLGFCGCTGYCHMAPNVVINDNEIHHVNPDTVTKDVEEEKKKPAGSEKPPEATAEEIMNLDFLGDL